VPLAVSHQTADLIRAAVYIVITLVIAAIVDRLMANHGGGVTRALSKNLPPSGKTRLRMARRLIVAAIIFVGVGFALFQLPQVSTVARAMLASAAFTAVVIGIAARSALSNPLAGIAIAITQPVRLGDYVTLDDMTGVVEEVSLSYTYIRMADNRRVVIPNETLASKIVHNYSIVEEASAATVEFVVTPVVALADVTRSALERATALNDPATGREPSVVVSDLATDGIHIKATVWAADKPTADTAAGALRLALAEEFGAKGVLAFDAAE
jgi:small-conductance mechanosensitive channel